MARRLYLGWDVGAWHCDRNRGSRDALVPIAGEEGASRPIGSPWWGNLRGTLCGAEGVALVEALLALCGAAGGWDACVIAIDAPLAWPRAFEALLAGTPLDSVAADSSANAYLLRECERRLIKRGLRPMSPIVQQIGSQAVKGQHFLARAGLELTRPGVWTPADGRVLAIEAYPSAARRSAVALGRYREVFGAVYERTAGERGQDADVKDARLCAVTALLLEQEPEVLAAPSGDAPRSEGWVWVPKDALTRNSPPNQP